jgi:hypothetical protein
MDVDPETLALLSKLGHHDLTEEGIEVFIPEKRPIKILKDIRRIVNKDIEDDDDFSSRSLLDVRAILRNPRARRPHCGRDKQVVCASYAARYTLP